MITVKHKFIHKTVAPGKEVVSERCIYCGEIRFRYLSGTTTNADKPCDWSKITDREVLADIINRRVNFFSIRKGAPPKRPNLKRFLQTQQLQMV